MARKLLLFLLAVLPVVGLPQFAPALKTQKVDYTGNYTATDRFWFYKNTDGSFKADGDGHYNSVEFESGRGFQHDKVVYQKGGTINIDVTVQNQASVTATGTLDCIGAELVSPVGTYTLSLSGSASINIAPGNTQTFTLTVTGLPGHVTKGSLVINAIIWGNVGFQQYGDPASRSWQSSGHSWAKVFVTEAAPTGLQAVPWTDLLEFSCTYGQGQSGTTNVASALTNGVFYGQIFAYNIGTIDITSNLMDKDTNEFDLSKFLNNAGPSTSPSYQPGNCVDVARLLMLCLQGLGVEATTKQLEEKYEDTYLTNPVCPIGSDSTMSSLYNYIDFGMHEQCYVGSNVYDAALAFDRNLSNGVHENPAPGWPMPGYWQTIIPPIPAPRAYGLAYRLQIPGNDKLWYINYDENGNLVQIAEFPQFPPPTGYVGILPIPISHYDAEPLEYKGPTQVSFAGIK